MPFTPNSMSATTAAVGDLVAERHLTEAQHRFLSRWPEPEVRRRWARRADLPAGIVEVTLSDDSDTDVLSALLAGPATCGPAHRRLYWLRRVRVHAIANAYRRRSDDPALLEQLCRDAWQESKTRFAAELAETGVTIDQLPYTASEGMVRYGAPRDVIRAVNVHRHHHAVRAAWARRLLSYTPGTLSADAHRLWANLPGLPDDRSLTDRLTHRARLLADAGHTWPGELLATWHLAGDPNAIRALIDTAGGNTNRVLTAVRAHRHRRDLLVRAVLVELDRRDPSGVTGFEFLLSAHTDDQHAGYLADLQRRVRAGGDDVTVVRAKAVALARYSQPSFGARHRDAAQLLGQLIDVHGAHLPALVDVSVPNHLGGNARFVAAIKFEHLDPGLLARFAARDDLLGEQARASRAIDDDLLAGLPFAVVAHDEHLWKRFVRYASGQLEPWQLLLLAESPDCQLNVHDAVMSIAAL